MKNVVILGSTGSIGESALRVAEALPLCVKVVGLAAHRSHKRVLQQAKQFHVSDIAVADVPTARLCASEAPAGVRVHEGERGVEALAALDDADIILCALVGMAGLKPVLAALGKGKDVALATKEVLVSAGAIVTELAVRKKCRLLPVDSEHSAIFQCVDGKPKQEIKRIVLTASGGPFALKPDIDFDKVTVAEALKHPRWNMGKKVTVDSATLMNKGLEIMEAHWLFGIPIDKIDIVVHPESIVHSLVEFVDGSVLAQLSPPDMRFAIQHALTYPERVDGRLPMLDLAKVGPLHFKEPDERRFPCLRLAREAARAGGTMPAVLNAANEVAVQKFLEGRVMFSGIWHLVERVMGKHSVMTKPGLSDILEADGWARKTAEA